MGGEKDELFGIIAKRYREITKAMANDEDLDGAMGEFYEQNARLIGENGRIYHGAGGMYDYYVEACQGIKYSYLPYKVEGKDDWVYSIGRQLMSHEDTLALTEKVQQTLTVWHKVDGKYKIHIDSIIGSRDLEPQNPLDVIHQQIVRRYQEINDAIIEDKEPGWLVEEFYEPDVTLVDDKGNTYDGHDGLWEYFGATCVDVEFRYKVEKISGDGDWAYSLGKVDLLDNKTKKHKGSKKFFAVWHKAGGKWKFNADSLMGAV